MAGICSVFIAENLDTLLGGEEKRGRIILLDGLLILDVKVLWFLSLFSG